MFHCVCHVGLLRTEKQDPYKLQHRTYFIRMQKIKERKAKNYKPKIGIFSNNFCTLSITTGYLNTSVRLFIIFF